MKEIPERKQSFCVKRCLIYDQFYACNDNFTKFVHVAQCATMMLPQVLKYIFCKIWVQFLSDMLKHLIPLEYGVSELIEILSLVKY